MAVQRKSQKSAPGQKKPVSWVKIVAVGFVVLVVVMCIISFCNFPNFFRGDTPGYTSTTTETVNDGDRVAVYFMMNTDGTNTFSYFPSDNNTDLVPYAVSANSNAGSADDDLKSISVKVGEETIPYRISAAERNAIAKAIVGKNYGDIVTTSPAGSDSEMFKYDAKTLEDLGCDMKTLKAGDVLPVIFKYTDDNNEEKKYVRYGVVTAVNDDLSGANVKFGTDTIAILLAGKYVS